MRDFKFNITTDGSGIATIGFPLTNTGAFNTISGNARMVQRVMRWMATPKGAMPYDPTFGNLFFDFLGTTQARDSSQWAVWLKQCEWEFLERQTQDVQQGNLTIDETVAAFTNEQIGFPTSFVVQLNFMVLSQANLKTALPNPLYYNITL